MRAIRLDIAGEKQQDLCNAAFMEQSYNWKQHGFNLWRCRRKRGHKGPHEDYMGVNCHDRGMEYVRFQWTDWRKQECLNDQAEFWRDADKERVR